MKIIGFDSRRRLLKSFAMMMMSLPLFYKLSFASEAWSSPSFEIFVKYTEQILGFDDLNMDMAKRIYLLVQDEPWGVNHLQRLVQKTSQAANDENILAQLDKGEHWFLEHLLTTWVTGIYYHDSKNVVVSYDHALMHEALAEMRPVPGYSEEEFGFWHQPPKSIRRVL